MTPDEELLDELLRSREACLERRNAAMRTGALRVRLHAIDSELTELVETIQRHCMLTGVELPPDVPAMRDSRAQSLVLAQRILERYLGLLRSRRAVRAAAQRAGDLERAHDADLAIRADLECIRKHCERSSLPLPTEILEGDIEL